MANKKWPEEVIQKWIQENATGSLPQQIADKWGVSKSTVIGVLDRRGFCADGKGTPKVPYKERRAARERLNPPKKRKRTPKATSRKEDAVLAQKMKRPVGRPDMDYPEREGVPLEALEKDQCRFIVTYDRPFRYCGKHTKGTYCQEHAERAYVQD